MSRLLLPFGSTTVTIFYDLWSLYPHSWMSRAYIESARVSHVARAYAHGIAARLGTRLGTERLREV